MQPKQFNIRPEGLREIRKRYLLIYIPIIFLAVSTSIAIAHFSAPEKDGDFTSLFATIPIVLIIMVYSTLRGLKRQRELLESYILSLEESSIVRRQANTPVISINHHQIKDIVKEKNGRISILTNESMNCIIIPPQIDSYNELQEALSRIHPIKEKSSVSLLQKYSALLGILALGLLALVFLSTNKLVVTIGGVILAGIMVWSLYVGMKSKNIDQKTKKGLVWIGIVLFAIISRIVLILLQ